MALFKSNYNKEYRVVVQPYEPERFKAKGTQKKRRRWFVSPNNLHYYIGSHNANTALLKASKCKDDKIRLKYRSFGIIDIYLK